MPEITDFAPDADTLLGFPIEERAHLLLKLAKAKRLSPNNWFVPDLVVKVHRIEGYDELPYPPQRAAEVDLALAEAWNWAQQQGFMIPVPGQYGYMMLTTTGERVADETNLDSYLQAASFPESLIHPAIRQQVFSALRRGDYSVAIRNSFIAVEEAVRAAGGFAQNDVGERLMRAAFDKDRGPLSDPNQPEPERAALAHLFAGAFGYFRNAHSHRAVAISDPHEAREITVFASLLLRIVDQRRQP
jgi:uncharacterized protein (TIGR02391 family)